MAVDMPPAEVEITPELVAGLLLDQLPDLAHANLEVLSNGWDNVSMRVGLDFVARLPRRRVAVDLVANEVRWLPHLAPKLPLPTPSPVFAGRPGRGFPWPWTLVPFIPGDSAALASNLDLDLCSTQLARFLRCLHSPAPEDAPTNPFRGVPLADRDEPTRERLERLGDAIDISRASEIWLESLAVPVFDQAPVWVHGDLHPHNLLVRDGEISGVIDFGDITAGDPATDLAVAWMLFPETLRSSFRSSYGADDATWSRARGWALSLAAAYLAQSADNPIMAEVGRRTMGRLLE